MTLPPRQTAAFRADAEHAVGHYRDTAGVEVARRLVDELERVVQRVAEFPAAGSPRYAELAEFPGLRSAAVGSFPYVAFYVERSGEVVLVRLLHGHRDLPELLGDATGSG